MHNKVLSILNYSIENDFQKSVLIELSAVNMQGILVKSYLKKFKDPFHLFETIEVKDFGEVCSIFLKGKYSWLKLYNSRKLLNKLCMIYGPDNLGQGKFCINDARSLNENMGGYYSRDWPASPDQIETSFSVDKEDNAVYLSLFGAQIPQEEKQMWASNERIYF